MGLKLNSKIATEVNENLDTAKNVFSVGDIFAVCTVIQFGIVVVQYPLLE